MRAAILLAAFTLSACDNGIATKRDARIAAEDAAEDFADAKTQPLADRLSDLESRVEEQEQQISTLKRDNDSLRAQTESLRAGADWDEQQIDKLFKNDEVFAQRLGIYMPPKQ